MPSNQLCVLHDSGGTRSIVEEMSKLPPPSGIMHSTGASLSPSAGGLTPPHSSGPDRSGGAFRERVTEKLGKRSAVDASPFGSPDVMPRTPGKGSAAEVRISSEGKRRSLESSIEQQENKRARRAEEDANRRIERAEDAVDQVRRESQDEIEKIQEDTEHEAEVERARSSQMIERIKTQGQSRIDELRRDLSKEISRIRREGEQHLGTMRSHYRDSLAKTQTDGENELKELTMRNFTRMEHEKSMGDFHADSLRDRMSSQSKQLQEHHDRSIQDLKYSQQTEMDRARSETDRAKTLAEERFQDTYTSLKTRQDQELQNLFERSQTMIERIREDSAAKLSAYDERQDDPFYKLQDLQAQQIEEEDQFVIRARVPLHEQKNISVSVRENQVTLSGHRRNQEQLDLSPGRTKSTSSFQVFSESFPLSLPVNPKGMVKLFDGDEMTILVPKKRFAPGQELSYQARKAADRQPARVRQERPVFPENIPVQPKPESDRPLPKFPDTGKRNKVSSGPLG